MLTERHKTLTKIMFLIVFMAMGNASQDLASSEKESLKGGKILKTFETEEEFDIFSRETVTSAIISDDALFKKLHEKYPFPEIVSSEKPDALGESGITFHGRIEKNAEVPCLHISQLADCVGIILHGTTYSGAYHVYCSELRMNFYSQEVDKNGNFAKWLDEYKAKEINSAEAKVFLASSFWTENVDDVMAILQDRGLNVHSMSIPDLQIVPLTKARRDFFVSSTSPYLERILESQSSMIPLSTQLAVNTETGAVWCQRLFTR